MFIVNCLLKNKFNIHIFMNGIKKRAHLYLLVTEITKKINSKEILSENVILNKSKFFLFIASFNAYCIDFSGKVI